MDRFFPAALGLVCIGASLYLLKEIIASKFYGLLEVIFSIVSALGFVIGYTLFSL